ncbi:hypothetical protein HPC49_48590 [Pyxidicoccus fallax]|uniref:Cytochrome oxidase complex assembly protein 1 n=1 Tax=Pyxidicoccus fallax TaxID=394095 RepID=A0A848LXW0_9BACT|nr:cytochrome c oxidase assembly factor Coa1 family protein [Pyxidicoccus fallax]NMO22451.1 hypothetical protein [Pyxidicoccus fallax]NPC86031.1 hypothetical protein [Pyxidicoccus fallax]
MNTMPEGSLTAQRGWWSRNWKWVVPVGCLGTVASCGCLGAIALAVGFSSLTQVGAYTDAVAIATSDAEVRRELGTPIDSGWPRQSSISSNNGRTQARFSIPLDGPQADGTLHVDAEGEDGQWHYRTLDVELEDGTRIDLRDDAPGAIPTPPEPPEPPVPPEPPFGAEPPGRGEGEAEEDAPPGRESDIEL